MAQNGGGTANIPAVGVIALLGGIIFAYSGIKGKSISTSLRALLAGNSPASTPQSTPIVNNGNDPQSNSGGVSNLLNNGTSGGGTLGSFNGGVGGAIGGARGKAVAYAQAQLGKPYVFAAAGPSAFDCSGLTMMAWRAAGVNILSHYTVSQYAETKHIPYEQAQPGDIILVSTNKALTAVPHHVVLYIGGGNCIEAYDQGYPVRIAPVSEYSKQIITVGQFPG